MENLFGERWRDLLQTEPVKRLKRAAEDIFAPGTSKRQKKSYQNPDFDATHFNTTNYKGVDVYIGVMDKVLTAFKKKELSRYVLRVSIPTMLSAIICRFIEVMQVMDNETQIDHVYRRILDAAKMLVSWFVGLEDVESDDDAKSLKASNELYLIALTFSVPKLERCGTTEEINEEANKYFSLLRYVYVTEYAHTGFGEIEIRNVIKDKLFVIAQTMVFVQACRDIVLTLINDPGVGENWRFITFVELIGLAVILEYYNRFTAIGDLVEQRKDLVVHTFIIASPFIVDSLLCLAPVTVVRIASMKTPEFIVNGFSAASSMARELAFRNPDKGFQYAERLFMYLGTAGISIGAVIKAHEWITIRLGLRRALSYYTQVLILGMGINGVIYMMKSEVELYDKQWQRFAQFPLEYRPLAGSSSTSAQYITAKFIVDYRSYIKFSSYAVSIREALSAESCMKCHTGVLTAPRQRDEQFRLTKNPPPLINIEPDPSQLTGKQFIKFVGMLLLKIAVVASGVATVVDTMTFEIREDGVSKQIDQEVMNIRLIYARDIHGAFGEHIKESFKTAVKQDWTDAARLILTNDTSTVSRDTKTFIRNLKSGNVVKPLILPSKDDMKTLLPILDETQNTVLDQFLANMEALKGVSKILELSALYESNVFGFKWLAEAWLKAPSFNLRFAQFYGLRTYLYNSLQALSDLQSYTTDKISGLENLPFGTRYFIETEPFKLLVISPLITLVRMVLQFSLKTERGKKNQVVEYVNEMNQLVLNSFNSASYRVTEVFCLAWIVFLYYSRGLSKEQEEYIRGYLNIIGPGERKTYNWERGAAGAVSVFRPTSIDLFRTRKLER